MHFILQQWNTLFLVEYQHKTLLQLPRSCSCPPGSSCESWGLLQITYPDITLGQNGRFFSFIALYREMTTIHQEELKRFLINSSESKLPSSKAELFVLLSTISSWTWRLEAKAVSYEVSRATPQDTLVTIRTGWRWVYLEIQDGLLYENCIKEYSNTVYIQIYSLPIISRLSLQCVTYSIFTG